MDAKGWSFDDIRSVDPQRAARLEACPLPRELSEVLAAALDDAIRSGDVRFAIDSRENKFIECRSIVQFAVPVEIYDCFFNARGGYRGKFHIAPDVGTSFNRLIIEAIRPILSTALPESFDVRKIEVLIDNGCRVERDVGSVQIQRDAFLSSLEPNVSKIWICERLYPREDGAVKDIGLAVLTVAERDQPKLGVPRWAKTKAAHGEGVRAPLPERENAWLDLKGGFSAKNGEAGQIKPQDKRARQIHETGWT